MSLPPITPDWPAPPGVRALCGTREGGVSTGPYASLNLGTHVGDRPEAVAENRARWQAALGGARPVYLAQVHGREVVRLDERSTDGEAADAAWTDVPGVACTIMVADCLTVLLATASGSRVAAAHAGWRGLAGGVIEASLAALAGGVEAAGEAEPVVAWLGPCIGPRRFEVGDEVKAVFELQDPSCSACFQAGLVAGKWWADLQALARRRLAASGVRSIHGNDGSDGWCTVMDESRFFSHRRDRVSGRFAASIWRT